MALNKKNRLKKKKDFEKVFSRGKSVKGNFLFVKYLENDFGYPRIAFVVSSKVSKKAVIRNRVRRLLSETSRMWLTNIRPMDVVVIVNKNIIKTPKDKITEDLSVVFKKIK
ncbi:MAG: ribonuclease P protein component [Candidatus Paceibacterota bacterium]